MESGCCRGAHRGDALQPRIWFAHGGSRRRRDLEHCVGPGVDRAGSAALQKARTAVAQAAQKTGNYSVVKSGLIGLTRYLATYWADCGVRANALCPGGVENNPPPEFLQRIGKLIPMGRMARVDEYQGVVAFLCSDASSYMNGAVVSMDGGRTAW